MAYEGQDEVAKNPQNSIDNHTHPNDKIIFVIVKTTILLLRALRHLESSVGKKNLRNY